MVNKIIQIEGISVKIKILMINLVTTRKIIKRRDKNSRNMTYVVMQLGLVI